MPQTSICLTQRCRHGWLGLELGSSPKIRALPDLPKRSLKRGAILPFSWNASRTSERAVATPADPHMVDRTLTIGALHCLSPSLPPLALPKYFLFIAHPLAIATTKHTTIGIMAASNSTLIGVDSGCQATRQQLTIQQVAPDSPPLPVLGASHLTLASDCTNQIVPC